MMLPQAHTLMTSLFTCQIQSINLSNLTNANRALPPPSTFTRFKLKLPFFMYVITCNISCMKCTRMDRSTNQSLDLISELINLRTSSSGLINSINLITPKQTQQT